MEGNYGNKSDNIKKNRKRTTSNVRNLLGCKVNVKTYRF